MSRSPQWTGERLVPSVMNEVAMEHLARYAFCLELVKDKIVLDAACGEGYGTNLLASSAKQVTGIDIDAGVIRHAKSHYKKKNISFINSSILQMPLESNSYDVIVSYETLEHLEEHDEVMTEFKRLLKPDGLLIISTPNIEEYTIKKNTQNRFHKKELTLLQFERLIRKYFQKHQLCGQQTVTASIIKPVASATLEPMAYRKGDFTSIEAAEPLQNPMYLLAVASDSELPSSQALVFSGDSLFEQLRKAYESTWSYKIGRFITSPVRLIKSFF